MTTATTVTHAATSSDVRTSWPISIESSVRVHQSVDQARIGKVK